MVNTISHIREEKQQVKFPNSELSNRFLQLQLQLNVHMCVATRTDDDPETNNEPHYVSNSKSHTAISDCPNSLCLFAEVLRVPKHTKLGSAIKVFSSCIREHK